MVIIGNGRLIRFTSGEFCIEGGAVCVEGKSVKDFGADAELRQKYPEADYIDARGGLIMPGLIDAHSRARYCMLHRREIPSFKPEESSRLADGLLRRMDEKTNHDELISTALHHARRCIKSGVTTVFEHHVSPSDPCGSLITLAGVYRECGIRACLDYEVSSRFGTRHAMAAVKESVEFIEYCEELNIDTVKPMIGLGNSLYLSNEQLEDCIRSANGRAGFHIRAGETVEEVSFSIRKFGARPLQRLDRLGIIGSRSIVSGCVYADSDEWELLLSRGGFASLTPNLAMLMGGAYKSAALGAVMSERACIGSAPLSGELISAAHALCGMLALDGAAQEDYRTPGAKMLFHANPLLASGVFGAGLGRIEIGAPADLIVMETNEPASPETEEECFSLLTDFGTRCTHTFVAGRLLMRDGELLNDDLML